MSVNILSKRLEKLFLKNYEKWFLIAYTYVKNHEDAEEIVHQVCYKVLDRKQKSFIEDLDGYVVVSIKNTCLKRIKSQKQLKSVDLSELPEIENGNLEDDVFFKNQRIKKLQDAISELPSSSKEIFRLCVMEEEKYDTVAEQTNLSINTIKYHVKKCYKILRLKLVYD
ncbi:RNA polymerase sigma factor [Maribacter litoralis]|uniref:RNA polymerase sigma factor n=1 Tax=Maribacter litoralis TaxID=2059726 RepID=UPI003F5CC671